MLRADVFVWNQCPDHCLHFLHFVSDRECLDCVFAAARIASLVHLNLVSVEHRRPPRSVPQPFTLKSVRSHLGLKEPERLKHIGSAGSGVVANLLHILSKRIVLHWQAREDRCCIARRSLVEQLPRKARPRRRAHASVYIASSPRPTRSSGACSARRSKTVRRENSFLHHLDTRANSLLLRYWKQVALNHGIVPDELRRPRSSRRL